MCWNARRAFSELGRVRRATSTVHTAPLTQSFARPPFEGSRDDGALQSRWVRSLRARCHGDWTRPFDVSASAPLFTPRTRESATQTSISPSRSSLVSPQLCLLSLASPAPTMGDAQNLRRALVLYGSETGNAQDVAEEMGRLAERLRFDTEVAELNAVSLVCQAHQESARATVDFLCRSNCCSTRLF